jgi:hypothetical protein
MWRLLRALPPPATEHARQLRVYLHPGRVEVVAISPERASSQFDLEAAAVFATLDDAESAVAGQCGFLLVADAPFTNAWGKKHEPGVFFVARLVRGPSRSK